MSRKKKHVQSVPPANRPRTGPPNDQAGASQQQQGEPGGERGFQEQDAKGRLGDFEGAGEHSYQQPGGLNDANR
jgi:hypothetical protein